MEIRIKSYKQLEALIKELNEDRINNGMNYDLFFRGQSLINYKLVNGISRFDYNYRKLLKKEKSLIKKYFSQINNGKIDFIGKHPKKWKFRFEKEWNYLYQGQHLGLITRLMDWSLKWDMGLFFSINNKKYWGKDGSLYIFKCPKEWQINSNDLSKIYNTYPLNIEGSFMINAPFFQTNLEDEIIAEHRRSRQSGRFFIQSNDLCLTDLLGQSDLASQIIKLTIDGDSKDKLYEEWDSVHSRLPHYRTDVIINNKIKKLNNKYFKLHPCTKILKKLKTRFLKQKL